MSEELVYVCEICQTVLDEHHCKAVCPNCGRMFDCSDLPLMHANAMLSDDHQGLVFRPGADPRDLLPQAPAPDATLHPSDAADGEQPADANPKPPSSASSREVADLP